MNSLDGVINEIREIIYKYRKSSDFSNGVFGYVIPFSAFEYNDDTRILGCYKIRMENFYYSTGKSVVISTDYYSKSFVIIEGEKMHIDFAVHIPYGSRSKYYRAMYDINNIVGEEGSTVLLVDNLPYSLKSVLLVEASTTEQIEKINAIIKERKLEKDNSFGCKEAFFDASRKKWSMILLPSGLPFDEFADIVSMRYWFAEEDKLAEKGYCIPKREKKKIFISYAHKDKTVVYDIVEKMEDYGLNVWIDKEQIDVGDRILERISDGMKECDLAIIFISNNTKEALYAQHELHSFFSSVIYKVKKWFIIKLDDVVPNEICYGLGDYLYFDYSENTVEELIEAINKKLKK